MIPDISDIEKYKLHRDLLQQVVQQVIKDFSMFGLHIEISGVSENAYEELVEQLTPHFNNYYNNHLHGLSGILYRIDIDEASLYKKIKPLPFNQKIRCIVDEVLKRELQKVVLRKYFSEGNT